MPPKPRKKKERADDGSLRMKDREWQWKPKLRGRPPRRGAAANVKITIRLTADERRAFRQAAGKKPITVWFK